MVPPILLSFASFVALTLQILLIFLQGGASAGTSFLCRLTLFFMAPFIFLLVFSFMAYSKIQADNVEDGPGYEHMWERIFIPLVLFGLSAAVQMYMVKPCFGRFVLRATLPFVFFLAALSAYLDRRIPRDIWNQYADLWGTPNRGTVYPFFIPLYVLLKMVVNFYRHLPFLWDAHF